MSAQYEEYIQQQYYEKTFEDYDAAHAEEYVVLKQACDYISFYAHSLASQSLLDVGCGTGRILKYFLENNPELSILGVEPVETVVAYGRNKYSIPDEKMVVGRGDALDLPDKSFDLVCEFAVLHHVRQPEKIIAEMTRVAKKAIFLTDTNRFGQGRLIERVLKLIIYKLGLWKIFDYIRTGGKGYMMSEGDGLFYSYSVYDSYAQLAQWADRIVVLPIGKPEKPSFLGWFGPLLTSPAVLLCAFRDS